MLRALEYWFAISFKLYFVCIYIVSIRASLWFSYGREWSHGVITARLCIFFISAQGTHEEAMQPHTLRNLRYFQIVTQVVQGYVPYSQHM